MSPDIRTFLTYLGALILIGVVGLVFIITPPLPTSEGPAETAQVANVGLSHIEPTLPLEVSGARTTVVVEKPGLTDPPLGAERTAHTPSFVQRIQNPYPTPPLSFTAVNERTQAALVNIFCTSGDKIVRPASGSGVIIDPRGIILTNAHIAQYVLLSKGTPLDLSCIARTGSPARPSWDITVLYIPPVWIEKHAADIVKQNPTGTGEHDYALLLIQEPIEPRLSQPSDASYPFLSLDTREAIGFPGELTLAAAYPAEFIGGAATYASLNPLSSLASINELLTFHADTVDLLSFKGSAEAQSGSSGGPIVNAWAHLIGIITTTSEGATTAERELRAITTSYIDRDFVMQTGSSLSAILAKDPAVAASEFWMTKAPALLFLLVDQISKSSS